MVLCAETCRFSYAKKKKEKERNLIVMWLSCGWLTGMSQVSRIKFDFLVLLLELIALDCLFFPTNVL